MSLSTSWNKFNNKITHVEKRCLLTKILSVTSVSNLKMLCIWVVVALAKAVNFVFDYFLDDDVDEIYFLSYVN